MDDWMVENKGQVQGTQVTTRTLMYVPLGGEFEPLRLGNQFSMLCADGNEYRIVNFLYENLEKVIRLGVPLPVNVLVLDIGLAAIHDARIPDRWYEQTWVQCPYRLLPAHQKLELMRDIQTGALQRKNGQWVHFLSAEPDRLPLEPPLDRQVRRSGPPLAERPAVTVANLDKVTRTEFTRDNPAT